MMNVNYTILYKVDEYMLQWIDRYYTKLAGIIYYFSDDCEFPLSAYRLECITWCAVSVSCHSALPCSSLEKAG